MVFVPLPQGLEIKEFLFCLGFVLNSSCKTKIEHTSVQISLQRRLQNILDSSCIVYLARCLQLVLEHKKLLRLKLLREQPVFVGFYQNE